MRDSNGRRWTHPETILVATDLSDLDHLMPFALEEARESEAPTDRSSSVGWDAGARLILLHVLSTTSAFTADASGMPYYDTGAAVEIAEQMMHPWCETAARLGIRCESMVRIGHPTQQIAAAACQSHADRVLLGTRSRGKLGRLLIGSVAEQVLRSICLPVITVGPEAHLPMDKGEERVVLHATALREASRPSAALACQVAAAQKAKLILLHVLPPISEMERKGLTTGMHSSAMLELRILAAQTGAGVLTDRSSSVGWRANCCSAVEPVVVHGNPSTEILALAAERRASLIVLGAMHRTALEDIARDRTVHRVLAHARCPVLTLREQQAMAEETHAVAASVHR
jgi:nucleotide-binding universal stress UspA family protein